MQEGSLIGIQLISEHPEVPNACKINWFLQVKHSPCHVNYTTHLINTIAPKLHKDKLPL